MDYIEIVNDAIQYIESNLHRKMELASLYYISPMHFYRIFRAVINQTIKSYILGRRLSQAAMRYSRGGALRRPVQFSGENYSRLQVRYIQIPGDHRINFSYGHRRFV